MTKKKKNFLYNNLYSSSLFYGLVVLHMHTGNKGDLDFRQLSCITNIMTKKGEWIQNSCLWMTHLILTVPHDTLDAVNTFLRFET